MVKKFGKCKLCKSNRFLNYAGLCKRCNQKPASSDIKEESMEKQLEVQKKRQEQKKRELEEKQALEEKGDLSVEEKERLVELTPGVETIDELEKKTGEKDDEKGSIPKKS
ncbi:MAG: hypothetical protein PVF96_04355 [Candidatus Bathyarchaeota archaeon]|jgi:hypothetical protein